MKAMILAAGLGTRLRPATLKIPKPAIPLLNVPLVGYSIYLLKAAGVKELVCNTHHLPDIMRDAVLRMTGHNSGGPGGSLTSIFSRVDFSDEEGMILGSAGGLKHAQKFLKGTGEFFLANGDEVFFPKNPQILKRLQEVRQRTSALATLL
ncbi:MAG: NTP transferase domain-containing protein, partial [Bdellovibrionales bacterium]|nr:NTP transferase domain-containing protein [Bdellovibrionales bacterium]